MRAALAALSDVGSGARSFWLPWEGLGLWD